MEEKQCDVPQVSVVLPVYNGSLYLQEAIQSILDQTFADFEFVIINDGSTDISESIIASFTDDRIRYFSNAQNIGLVATLNRSIELSTGRYIARMDQDDVAMEDRIRKQLEFMDKNPDVVICGTDVVLLGTELRKAPPRTDSQIRASLLFRSPFYHPTVMIRKTVLDVNGLRYSEAYKHAEDYGLWVELLAFGKLVNLPFIGLKYRKHETQYTEKYEDAMAQTSSDIRRVYLDRLGLKITDEDLILFETVAHGKLDFKDKESVEKAGMFLSKFPDQFQNTVLDIALLKANLSRVWKNNMMRRQEESLNSYVLFLKYADVKTLADAKVHIWFLKRVFSNLLRSYFLRTA